MNVKKPRLASQSRAHLAERFAAIGDAARFTPPYRGWIRAVREALGLTTTQLAVRMGVKQPTLVAFEQAEAKGSIQLATLRRAAEALDCTLVYALVPKRTLEATLRGRARDFLRRRLDPVAHSMLLENQKVEGLNLEAQLDEVIRETNPRLFWDER